MPDFLFHQYHLFYFKIFPGLQLIKISSAVVDGLRTDYMKLFADAEFENILINRSGAL
jgi:hypothetical protein